MLEVGGAHVYLAAFERGKAKPFGKALSLGLTRDADFVQRIWRVLMALVRIPRTLDRAGYPRPDAIVARNMEALALGVRLKALWGGSIPLAYELLDIHRLQQGFSTKSKVVRAVEARFLKSTDIIIISSDAFRTHYLEAYDLPGVPTTLVENKVFLSTLKLPPRSIMRREQKRPGIVSIGWFGILRCSWTLSTLDRLTRENPGRFHIAIRGRPALDQVPNFHAVLSNNPDLHYGGPYNWPDDLASNYEECDLVWMIDRFDSGGNSDWLLPNRLYEGMLFGAVPIGVAETAIAEKLEEIGIGLVLPNHNFETLSSNLRDMDSVSVGQMRSTVLRQPLSISLSNEHECRTLVSKILHGQVHSGASSRKLDLPNE
ncbi:glycosyltransferase family 4 protein [Donghicola sp. C2-DW-16]|uniref:Glycosyltransferase family 4 protein n=1 Tax=Donghicola mangrovi TaxID=2729614 RepID=A0ABX2PJM2_9RHOB|nr:glycosyltransferase [Donghicola mangrovi]NVO29197.1 glycosyltransferase family 4 protein [Donghicola mangrovi]